MQAVSPKTHDKSITYNQRVQHSIKASNTCFIYAIQGNITTLTNICKFYIFKKKLSIKNAWKSDILIRLHTIREVLFYSRFVWAVFYVVPQLGLGNHMYCIQWTTSKFCTRVVLQYKWEQIIKLQCSHNNNWLKLK